MLELYLGIHDLSTDVIKCALFDSSTELNPDTLAYSTTGEIVGSGYTAGGEVVAFSDSTPKLVSRRVVISWTPITWTMLVPLVRQALIYNSSKSNRAMWVIESQSGHLDDPGGGQYQIPAPTGDYAVGMIAAM